jgi:prepilin-type N-terminal cleavage/methylation domain-containing protein
MWTHSRRPTYTLIEVIAVVAILAILASMAVPRFGYAAVRYRADAAAARIVADLEFARRCAHQASVPQVVQFDVAADTYRLSGLDDPDRPGQEYAVDLRRAPYQAEILAVDFSGDTKVSFDAYRMPDNGGTISIAVGDSKRTINVDADTGEASLP